MRLNGVTGTVEEITLRHTVICTSENSRLVVPNSVVNSSTLENITMKDLHCCNYLDVGVGYHADTDEAIRIMEEEILRHPLFFGCTYGRRKEKRCAGGRVPLPRAGRVFGEAACGDLVGRYGLRVGNAFGSAASNKKRFQSAELSFLILTGMWCFKESVPAALAEEKSN